LGLKRKHLATLARNPFEIGAFWKAVSWTAQIPKSYRVGQSRLNVDGASVVRVKYPVLISLQGDQMSL
jgi:hypothetical protein